MRRWSISIVAILVVGALAFAFTHQRVRAPERLRPLSENPSAYASYMAHACDDPPATVPNGYFLPFAVDCVRT
jgi:hypothetical protein